MKKPDILYQDDTCLALNKPAGLAVQGGKGVRESVDSWLQEEFGVSQERRPLLVHRLDKDTSGILFTAKGPKNAAFYARLIGGRQAVKRYAAVCSDSEALGTRGSIRLNVEAHGEQKAACTHYRLLKRGCLAAEGAAGAGYAFALLELELETGRTHQIRQHLQKTGCPVWGDGKYGDFALNRYLRKTRGLKRLLLHATRLSIPHKEGGLLDISAPLPPAFEFEEICF